MKKDLGRSIRIYLANGKPSGVQVAEIINWTGQVIKCPRAMLDDLANRDEVKQPGVYILVGSDPETPRKHKIYIGEADNVYKRLKNHLSSGKKEFWTDTLLITSKDENLTKSHVGYLESRLISIVSQSDRATLSNSTSPTPHSLPQADQDDMEYFLQQAELILPVLGFEFLSKKKQFSTTGTEETSPTFILESVGAKARAKEIDGEFVVQKGSTARKEGTDSWDSYIELREELVKEGKLVDSGNNKTYKFADDVSFNSPSAAAAVVCATNKNGPKSWRLENEGISYKEWQQKKVEKAENESIKK